MKKIKSMAAPVPQPVLPTGTPAQMVDEALGWETLPQKAYRGQVTATDDAAQKGRVYDRKTRARVEALLQGLSGQKGEQAQKKVALLIAALGIDPQALATDLQRQETAWSGYLECFTIRDSVSQGLRIVDGTRRLARGVMAADAAAARASMAPADQRRLDDDLRLYQDALAEDVAGAQATRKLTQSIQAAGQQQIGAFQDRRNLVDTLDRLAAQTDLPWDVLVKAGNTLDSLTAAAQGTDPPGADPQGTNQGTGPQGANQRTRSRL